MYILSFLTLAICIYSIDSSKLPSSWKICKRSDKKIDECLKPAIEQAVLTLKDGSPSLGVLPIDPLHFNELNIGQGSGPVSINLNFKNFDIFGIASFKLDRLKSDWDKIYMEGDATFNSPVSLLGDYKIEGKVLVLPITGEGKCNITFDGFATKLSIQGHEITKGKEKYVQLDKFVVMIDTKKLYIHLENLFNGDKALGDNMNLFLNENWPEILKELKPAISKAVGQAFKDVANKVFTKIPFNQIAPA